MRLYFFTMHISLIKLILISHHYHAKVFRSAAIFLQFPKSMLFVSRITSSSLSWFRMNLTKLWIRSDILVGHLERGLVHHKASAHTGRHNAEKHSYASIPRAGFEPTIPVFERSNTIRALNRKVPGTGYLNRYQNSINFKGFSPCKTFSSV
jgi:hypothetical protein